MSREMLTLDLGCDRTIRLLAEGAGEPIVLIHGAIATHADWLEAPFAAFARLGRVIAVDRPGHGQSRRPRHAAAPREQAAQIRAALRAIGAERCSLVGHSFGGLVALAYAAAFPAEVERLLLIAPIARPEPRPMEHLLFGPRAAPWSGPFVAEAAGALDPLVLPLIHRAMFWPQTPPDGWLERYPYGEVLSRAHTVEEGEDSLTLLPHNAEGWVDLSRVTAPAAIIAGSRDLVADPDRHARPLARRLGAPLEIVEGVGHMVHHVAFDRVLQQFVTLSSCLTKA